MPWCPNCRTEYKEGVETCTDCGAQLVEELKPESDTEILCTIKNKEIAEKLVNYLNYSKFDATYELSENEDEEPEYVVLVPKKDYKKAWKTFKAFYSVEVEHLVTEEIKSAPEESTITEESLKTDPDNHQRDSEDFSGSDEDEDNDSYEDTEKEKESISKMMYDGGAYEKKSEKVKDLRATALTFFIFGFLGLVFMALNFLDVLSIVTDLLPRIVMTALFIGFLYVGFTSVIRAKKEAKNAELEENLTNTLSRWLMENITEQVIASMKEGGLSEEANFIRILEGVKAMVVDEFGEMDEAYLDYVIEEFYNNRFES